MDYVQANCIIAVLLGIMLGLLGLLNGIFIGSVLSEWGYRSETNKNVRGKVLYEEEIEGFDNKAVRIFFRVTTLFAKGMLFLWDCWISRLERE